MKKFWLNVLRIVLSLLAWNYLWTPLTVICDIVIFPVFLIIQGYFK